MSESDERITRAANKLKRLQDSGEAWAARQAVGDAVALRAIELIRQPPAELPEMSAD